MTPDEKLTAEEYQDAIELTRSQQKAFAALKRALIRCNKESANRSLGR